jgi:hypothetical protein
MPRLSLWSENHRNDYKFFDRRISEMFTIGGTGVVLHKYLGVDTSSSDGTDATKPAYDATSVTNIQDLLFLENRDRKYDTSIYTLRGHYQIQDQDFDLRQFGIFLAQGTTFMTFHLNDMIASVGRKIIAGDVLELLHLKDYHNLDDSVPFAIKRFYVVSEAQRAAEGFSPTWWPHLWRVKLQPLVDSQEYKDILNNISGSSDPFAANANAATSTASVVSTYSKYLAINEAIITQAEREVPESGYDTSRFYTVPKLPTGNLGDPTGINIAGNEAVDGSSVTYTADSGATNPDKKIRGYLVGDGTGPNGIDVQMGLAFPGHAKSGDYFLRLDFMPNRLFRFDGSRWIKVEDAVRTNLTPGATGNKTARNLLVTNTDTYTTLSGNTHPQRQSLSKALKPPADN